MIKQDDFLVEVFTEELPPKSLLGMAEAFCQQIKDRLQKMKLTFDDIKFFATPRRLAVLVKDLQETQPEQIVERKGPAISSAFDADGNPTPASVGFARSCKVTPADLKTLKNAQGEWLVFHQVIPGKYVGELLPEIVAASLLAIPLSKRMRFGDGTISFARPIHHVMMLYGDKIVAGNVLGFAAKRVTQGHRFHAPDEYTVMHAAEYESLLRNEAYVIADFESRRSEILSKAKAAVETTFNFKASLLLDHALLDEVTGLVEWPVILLGHFDATFLELPPEVLISAMQDHQRYFPIVDQNQKLLPHFVIISNIDPKDPDRVIRGNERVLRARLSDAAFFYQTDKKTSLTARLPRLQEMIFQTRLGSLHDKAERLSKLTSFIAQNTKPDEEHAQLAGMLAKTDLTTHMVGEFPELQGVMGYYYACHDGLPKAVAIALREQYLPRFAGDLLPETSLGLVLALADRIDTLVGTFGINQIPTGDKDPLGLRRATQGIIRIMMEKQMDLPLQPILTMAVSLYRTKLDNKNVVTDILWFMQERLRAFYQEQGTTADVFNAVSAIKNDNILDICLRIKAVETFKKLPEAEALSIANKRVSNILAKHDASSTVVVINPSLFENNAEKILAEQLASKNDIVSALAGKKQYDEILLQLAALRQPVDDFFDHVMVMTEDEARRENRILLLRQLRALFLQVADIALLQ